MKDDSKKRRFTSFEDLDAWKACTEVRRFISKLVKKYPSEERFRLIDDMLAQLYGVRPKEIDIGKNNYGVAQLEIGYYSIVILPVVILVLLILMSYLNKLTNQNPFFLWLFLGNILF